MTTAEKRRKAIKRAHILWAAKDKRIIGMWRRVGRDWFHAVRFRD